MKLRQIITSLLLVGVASAHETETNRLTSAEETEEAAGRSWMVAPLVVMNPAFGNGGGAVGMYFFRPNPNDLVSPASTVSLVGLYSDTDSHFVGLFAKTFLKKDHWRVAGGAVNGTINNEFEIDGFSQNVEFATLVNAAFTRIDRRISGNYFIGGIAGVVDINYREGNDVSKIYFDLFDVEDNLSGQFAFVGFLDSRDERGFYIGVGEAFK